MDIRSLNQELFKFPHKNRDFSDMKTSHKIHPIEE